MATVSPYHSKLPVGRDGLGQLLRSEFTKFRSVRAWLIALGVSAVLIIVFAWIGSQQSMGQCMSQGGGTPVCTVGAPTAVIGPGGEPVVDTFSFVHQELVGSGSITARVTSLETAYYPPTGPNVTRPIAVGWAKAGVIIKQDTTEGSAYAAVMITRSHGVRMQYDYVNDKAGLAGVASSSSPRWLRLSRSGDQITGYDSVDGFHWSTIGSVRLRSLSEKVQVGLFVTSPTLNTDSGLTSPTMATGKFDQVHLSGDLPDGNWSDQVVGSSTSAYFFQSAGSNWFGDSGGIFTISGSGDIAPQVAGEALGGSGDSTGLLASGAFGLIAIIVLASVFITSEYRRGLIRTTLTATPRRGRALAAKAVVMGSVTFLTAGIMTGFAEFVSRHELETEKNYLFPVSAGADIRIAVGTGLLFAFAAVLVLSLATILRRSAGAVVTGIVVFVVPFIVIHPLSAAAANWLFSVTPVAAFATQGALPRFSQVSSAYTLQNGYYPLNAWAGLAVLLAYSAVMFAVAVWTIKRRDV